MGTRGFAANITAGSTTYVDRDDAVREIAWNPHARFEGVSLKHVVRGTDTAGLLSCHVVRLDPGAVLDTHFHETQWELHEVVDGEGMFVLGLRETPYFPGRMAVIPKGAAHKVIAGKDGLLLLAKFFPALL
jgi:mannose-6-phosphate isomerase-like protein (cupin superfamily)